MFTPYKAIDQENLRGKERVERASTEMEILHEAKQPRPRVPARLPQSLHGAHRLGRVANAITLHACVRHFALFGGEPGGCQRCVGEEEEAEYGYEGGYCSFAGKT